MADVLHKTVCRVCSGKDLVEILDLGSTPPANAYLSKEDLEKEERRFPLVLYFCRTCTLAQLLDVVNPEILFKGYHYLTSASDPLMAHFEQYAKEVISPLLSSSDDLVVDIGGNDGVLLGFLKDKARVLNIDPAENLAPVSVGRGVPFYPAFFSSNVADEIIAKYGHATVITANNVLAHTDPLQEVFSAVANLLTEDGRLIFEVHWVKHLLQEGSFDQIYHEHLCFHSLHALKYLAEKSGMRIIDVEIVPMQGQSLRVHASKKGAASAAVENVLEEEKKARLTDEGAYHAFAEVVRANKEKVLSVLRDIKSQDKKIVGYGAPAKSGTLLNYYGIGTETLDYITDTTTVKQGLYSPGMHVPIVSPQKLQSDPPDYILLLAWNFKDFILEKEKELRNRGVQFIIPVPTVEII